MNKLTDQQKRALQEVRQGLYNRLKNFWLTQDMLSDKSLYQLVCLIELLVGHYNYCPTFTHTCATLEEMFGEALWEKPIVPQAESKTTIN